MGVKYQFLEDFLRAIPADVTNIKLSFQNVEQIIRDILPPASFDHRQWWENQSELSTRPQARAWTNAGFKVESVGQKGRWVRFGRL